jgi:hypothetical protein
MVQNFFHRLRSYYEDVARVLRDEASSASIFPNSSDIGTSRESIYAEFLRQHAPAKCNVFFGGFVFGKDGSESRQLDIIVTTDTTPKFNFHNKVGTGKSFSPVEGTLGVISIKSTLDKNQLDDALAGIASVPPTSSLEGRTSFLVTVKNYDDWPYKIIYSSKGISGNALLGHLNQYFVDHPEIPFSRRPNLIHVSGKYVIVRAVPGITLFDTQTNNYNALEVGTFHLLDRESDIQGLAMAIYQLQVRASASAHISFSYDELINSLYLP